METSLDYWLYLISNDHSTLENNNNFTFKVAIFDLDLTLWDSKKLFDDVREILECLSKANIKMYIASFHTQALECCKQLNIDHFFEDIHYGQTQTKAEMIQKIIKNHPYIPKSEFVFFDDNLCNIFDVKRNTGIRTILVNQKGLNWSYIPTITLQA